MFRSVLVANRGEIAHRILRALSALEIRSVAVCSEADRDSPHLELADEVVMIGGPRSSESYLNMEAILAVAEQRDCQAVHPGFGFLAENARFAAMCTQARVTFIGPSPKAIRTMGDKAVARETMRAAGLPPIPGAREIPRTADDALRLAEDVGYPVLLKASAGGGGRGMRVVEDESGMAEAFVQASLESEKAFGNRELYLEKFIRGGRHIEFQLLADVYGSAVHLGERECSVQRNHQKLVEEAPSPVVTDGQRAEMGAKVAAAASQVGYVNAGTVEFLRDPEGHLYFMEMNTRLQVEHPVTEMITGFDIVREQIAIAVNRPLSITQDDVSITGHAIECRINAEDPDEGFKPTPGTVTKFDPPEGIAGVRIETHVREGYVVPPFYDSMIAKLITHGADRAEAIERMKAALSSFSIEGVKTTIPVHLRVLDHPDFVSGEYDTGLIGKMLGGEGGDGNG